VSEAREFLGAVFGDAPSELWLLIWTLPDKRSSWYRVADLDAAAEYAGQTDRDTYVGVALSPEDFGPTRRCPSSETAGICALWADVDFAGPAHRKSNLPPDEDSAMTLVNECGIEPSIIVHSGHGIQAWWLLDEPWVFTNDDDRMQAVDLASRWNATLRARAIRHGWTIDATHDLARVMRLPGTQNWKT
jgi:putative DNA primase/helicase